MQSFDTLIKHRVRAEYRDFLRKTVLRHKKPDELKVLCLPGWEAIEVYDVYDKLGVPRQNIYGVEWNEEAYRRLRKKNLGINVWYGDVFQYFWEAAVNPKCPNGRGDNMPLILDFKPLVPLFLSSYSDENGNHRLEPSESEMGDALMGAMKPNLKVPEALFGRVFDIISLDICGHVTGRVLNGLSAMFCGGLLADRGVFTLTSLASREQNITEMFLHMALLMDGIFRQQMMSAAEATWRGPLWKERFKTYDDLADLQNAMRERLGLEALVLFISLGGDSFMKFIQLWNAHVNDKDPMKADSTIQAAMQSIIDTEYDKTAYACRRIRRIAYQSGHSSMRTAFIHFRKATKAVAETDNALEVLFGLFYGLNKDLETIATPIPPPLSKQTLAEQIGKGAFRAE